VDSIIDETILKMDIYIYKTKQHPLKSRSLEVPELYRVTGKMHTSCKEERKSINICKTGVGPFFNDCISQDCFNTVPAGTFTVHKGSSSCKEVGELRVDKIEL